MFKDLLNIKGRLRNQEDQDLGSGVNNL